MSSGGDYRDESRRPPYAQGFDHPKNVHPHMWARVLVICVQRVSLQADLGKLPVKTARLVLGPP